MTYPTPQSLAIEQANFENYYKEREPLVEDVSCWTKNASCEKVKMTIKDLMSDAFAAGYMNCRKGYMERERKIQDEILETQKVLEESKERFEKQ